MKTWKQWSIVGTVIALLMGAGVAVAQLPNTLNISSAPSGTAPAIRASGIDANVSINLVPKGSGTVQVNGSPIAVSGGTVASLTINPGPLAVTGTTNLTGPLFIQPGTAVGLKLVGARVFHAITDQPTTGTVIETLYTTIIPANTLAVNGQSLRIKTTAVVAANANNKNWQIDFGATTLYATAAVAFNNVNITIECELFRTGAATQKSLCQTIATTAAGGVSLTTNSGSLLTTPAETLSGPITINFRGTTPTAAADLTARYAIIDWHPVGQ